MFNGPLGAFTPHFNLSTAFNSVNIWRMEGAVIGAVVLLCVVGFVITGGSYEIERAKRRAKRRNPPQQLAELLIIKAEKRT